VLGGSDIACLPLGGTPDGFAVQTTDTGRIAWCAKGGSCRVEDRDLRNTVCSWAEGEGRESVKFRVLFIEEKTPNEIFKVHLANVCPEHLERSTGVL